MTELGFCTLFWELTGLFFALTVPLTHLVPMARLLTHVILNFEDFGVIVSYKF